jgi:2-hydroxy-3-oxopropionate reductase
MTANAVSRELQPAGFIGLGIMGAPMVRNLLHGGVAVRVWARRLEQAQKLVTDGAVAAESLAALVAEVRVLFLNVSDTPDVENLMLGEGGILEHARPG